MTKVKGSEAYLARNTKLPGSHDATSAPPTKTKNLEVKRKFIPYSSAFRNFRRQEQWPGSEPIRPVSPHDGFIFTDIYHDTSGLLLLNARIYLRQRNSEWQVKTRRSGDLVSTGCVEVSGKAHVESALRSEGFHVSLASLEAVAKIETARSSWRVGKFTVSVDESLLLLDSHGAAGDKVVKVPHSVGEVELWEEADENSAGNRMKEMTQEIDDFMGRHEEVFKRKHDGLCQQIP